MERLFEKGAHREVIRLFLLYEEDLRDDPLPRLTILAGHSFKALGLYEAAIQFYQTAWKGEEQESPALILDWAEALLEKENPTAALPLVQKLVDHPALPGDQKLKAYRLLIRSLHRQGRVLEALKAWEAAVTLFPALARDPESRFMEGILAFEVPGLTQKAFQALRGVAAQIQDPVKTAIAYERLGDLFFGERQYEEAWRAYYQSGQVHQAGGSPFLSKKITQCRLMLEPKKPGQSPGTPVIETDPFWKKLQETRVYQHHLENQVNALRLN